MSSGVGETIIAASARENRPLSTANECDIEYGPIVDASDVLPDGRRFQNIDEYKQLLLDDKDQLARSLAMKFVEYATVQRQRRPTNLKLRVSFVKFATRITDCDRLSTKSCKAISSKTSSL